ncbi:arsenate reductase family protein [Streptococcus sp. HF-1907]|uniref:arsenate reductase family protein n=1 Tax=Streptococcus sp. HF-1907 TaxID=2785793 RepID=UPI00189E0521|nr:arsenate reductase family protein [Streptococcus sp. HF-1907]MBF7094855.1 arsenate reductase family protein [Streptococcus sp. HF-1907]
MYTFYQYPKCTTCRRAKAELESLGVDFTSIDIKENPPKAELILEWMETSDYSIKNFFNTSGQSYRALGLKDKMVQLSAQEAADLLASDGMLIKRPILLKDGKLLQVGYRKVYVELGL